jgi:ssDNA thymidine ADP-ribosyltransferase, DarT
VNWPATPPHDEAVIEYVAGKGISEVLHFTTNLGAVGIFATGMVRSRDRLASDQTVQHIYTPNCASRIKDIAWTDYVSMSISRVNDRMLGVSQRWHSTEDLWWVVLAFDVSLLADPGVYFVTTNNTYTSCLRRGTGISGLEALFAQSVEWGWQGTHHIRYPGTPDAWTTDPQAEVLYPGEVPVSRLRAVYVRYEEHADSARAWLTLFPNVPSVPVEHKPEVFG